MAMAFPKMAHSVAAVAAHTAAVRSVERPVYSVVEIVPVVFVATVELPVERIQWLLAASAVA
jgi:hypothetical protein